VDHPSRLHLDIETDDVEAEVKRLEALGAVVVEALEQWTVMQAPAVIDSVRYRQRDLDSRGMRTHGHDGDSSLRPPTSEVENPSTAGSTCAVGARAVQSCPVGDRSGEDLRAARRDTLQRDARERAVT